MDYECNRRAGRSRRRRRERERERESRRASVRRLEPDPLGRSRLGAELRLSTASRRQRNFGADSKQPAGRKVKPKERKPAPAAARCSACSRLDPAALEPVASLARAEGRGAARAPAAAPRPRLGRPYLAIAFSQGGGGCCMCVCCANFADIPSAAGSPVKTASDSRK